MTRTTCTSKKLPIVKFVPDRFAIMKIPAIPDDGKPFYVTVPERSLFTWISDDLPNVSLYKAQQQGLKIALPVMIS